MVFVTERDPGVGVSSFLPPRPPLQRAPGEKRPENRRVLPLGWLGAGRGDGWLCNCCPLVHAAAGSPGSPAAPAQSLGCWGMLAAAGRLLASSVAFCPVKIILKLVLLAGRKYALPCPAHISASLASGLCRVPWQRLCARSWRLEAAKTREVWLFQLHPNFLCLSTHVSSAWGLEPGPKRSRRLACRVLAVFLPQLALDVPVRNDLRDCSSLRAARGLSVHQSAQSWWRALPAAPRPFLLEFWGLLAGSPRRTSEGEMAEFPQHEVVPAANPQPANCLQTFLLRGCSLVARRERQPPSRGPAPPLALGRGGFLNPNNGCDQRANNTPASDGAQLNTNLIRVPI